MSVEQIINKTPLLIIGTGVHKHYCGNKNNAFSDWKTMLHEVRMKLKIVLPEQLTDNLPLVWEQMVLEATREGFKKKNNWQKANQPASKHEIDLRKTVKEVLQEYPGIKGSVDIFHAFNPSAVLSLNFDDKWTFGSLESSYYKLPINELGILNNHYYQLFYRGINDNVPVYFPNGHVNHREHLRLGYRDFGIQAEGLRKAFSWFKAWENAQIKTKTENENRYAFLKQRLAETIKQGCRDLTKNKVSWVHYFMLTPILIVGADISRHETGLRWLFMQRQRNLARQSVEQDVFWITTENHYKQKEFAEYRALGIEPVVFKSWDAFWDTAKNLFVNRKA